MARLRNPLIFRDPAYATNISVDLLLSKVLKEGGYKLCKFEWDGRSFLVSASRMFQLS